MNPWLRTADSSAVTEHLATSHSFDRRFGLPGGKVSPGEYFVADAEVAIVTVLGPCISACVCDREQRVGGAVMESLTESSVGDRNATFVIDYLKPEGIPIVASDLLGAQPRKVCFFPLSGRVLMKKLDKVKDLTLAEGEGECHKRLRQEPIVGDVELFG